MMAAAGVARAMRARGLAALALALVCGLGWGHAARADSGHGAASTAGASEAGEAPLEVKLILVAPPGGRTVYGSADPIRLILQVRTTRELITTAGFAEDEFRSYLTVLAGDGRRDAPRAAGRFHRHPDARVFTCHRGASGGAGRPVTPAEALAGPGEPDHFAFEYEFADLRELMDLGTGVHVAEVRVPVIAFPAILTDCRGLVGEMADLRSATPYTVASNRVAFTLSDGSFGGFSSPLVDDDECERLPCNTFKVGRGVPVKFKLSDAHDEPIKTARVSIAVTQTDGKAPLQATTVLGEFRFDSGLGNYIFNWDTTGYARGTWRIDALFEDGTVRSVHVGLK